MQSRLLTIINRLAAMAIAAEQTHADQRREFTQFGVFVCEVSYQVATGEYVVSHARDEEQLVFDDLDLAAIEVYDCLYDFRHTF